MELRIHTHTWLSLLTTLCTLLHSVHSLTGLCHTPEGHATCFACSTLTPPVLAQLAPPRDCCGDPQVFSLCQRCLLDPRKCGSDAAFSANTMNTLQQNKNNAAADFTVKSSSTTRGVNGGGVGGGSMNTNNELMELTRRAKYFLGKREHSSRPFASDAGKEDWFSDVFSLPDQDSAFLQDLTRGNNKKNNYNNNKDGYSSSSAYVDKKASPFLGKRMSYMVGNEEVETPIDASDYINSLSPQEKRQRPFLGKRTPWSMDQSEPSDSQILFQSDETDDKRSRPFLGKRNQKYFLGKRGASQAHLDSLKNFYMRPLARRAKYFLGKRSDVLQNPAADKRQKYFLGKRAASFAGEENVAGQNGLMFAEDSSSQVEKDKRQKYFLGKRGKSTGTPTQ